MKLQKVIFYFPNFSEGGVENTSIKLSNYFTKNKIKIHFVSFKPPNKKYFKNNNLITFTNFRNKKVNWLLKNFFCSLALVKVFLENNKKNTVIFALSNLNLCIMLCKLFNFKIVSRNSAPIDYFKYDANIFDFIKFSLKSFIYPLSDLIIANSKNSAKKLSKKMAYKSKIISIPNPIDKPKNKKSNLKSNSLLYVGRFSKEKGVFQLINAFEIFIKKNKKFSLNLIGSGSQKKNLINYIKYNNLKKNIFIHNWSNDLSKYYLNSKVLVLPSYFEGFGNVLIEALSYSLPCISVRNDGPKEILKNGKYGLLIKDNSPQSIVNGLNKLLKSYKIFSYKAQLGYKKNVRYDLKRVGNLYLKKINSVLN